MTVDILARTKMIGQKNPNNEKDGLQALILLALIV